MIDETGIDDTGILQCMICGGDHETDECERPEEVRNPIYTIAFRAGLIACRESMARFVEAQDPSIAASIRANWWPSLGKDYGPPRLLNYDEVCDDESEPGKFKAKPIDATLEALPEAYAFLNNRV